MQNKRWLRYGLASLTLMGAASLSTLLVACGDDEEPTPIAPKPDGGDTDPNPDPDPDPTSDAGADATTPPEKDPARLQMINAATDFGPNNVPGIVRVCFGAGTDADATKVTPLPALPEASAVDTIPPGVPIGLGGNVTGTGLNLADLYIQPYLMNGVSLAEKGIVKKEAGEPSTSCAELLKADFKDKDGNGLKENEDYWKLPLIEKGTLLAEKSYLLVLTGCAADATADAAKCGPGFTAGTDPAPGIGNLKIHIHEIDRATKIDDDKIGVQFVHASAAGEAFLATQPGTEGGLKVVPGFITGTDPGTFKAITGDGTPGSGPVDLNKATELRQIEGVTFESDSFTANPNVAPIALPLPLIQGISFPTGAPDDAKLRNGAAFTFIAVGDPTVPAGDPTSPNPKTFHYLAFPNNPPISVYTP